MSWSIKTLFMREVFLIINFKRHSPVLIIRSILELYESASVIRNLTPQECPLFLTPSRNCSKIMKHFRVPNFLRSNITSSLLFLAVLRAGSLLWNWFRLFLLALLIQSSCRSWWKWCHGCKWHKSIIKTARKSRINSFFRPERCSLPPCSPSHHRCPLDRERERELKI